MFTWIQILQMPHPIFKTHLISIYGILAETYMNHIDKVTVQNKQNRITTIGDEEEEGEKMNSISGNP